MRRRRGTPVVATATGPVLKLLTSMLTVRNEARRENVCGYTKEGDSLCLEK